MRNRMLKAITAILFLYTLSMVGFAHEVPDHEQSGSITVMLQDGEKKLQDGTLTFYRVGQITSRNGNYEFTHTPAYSGCDVSLMEEYTPEVAAKLLDYTLRNQVAGETLRIRDGLVRYPVEKGQLGLYLVAQQEPSTGYYEIEPFLISVPGTEGDGYVYDVNAEPKMGPLHEKEEPSEPSEVPGTEPVETTPGNKLPQTGQLKFPVPVLVILGLCLIGLGAGLKISGKKREHEK